MKREWKPGDVAVITGYDHPIPAVRVENCREHKYTRFPHWHYLVPNGAATWTSNEDVSARALVVIDPEDRDQIERLAESYRNVEGLELDNEQPMTLHGLAMRHALREFANPKPPKPEEPTGLGAVVEDADGRRWVRTDDERNGSPWTRRNTPGTPQHRAWSEITAVRILSEGVTA